MSELGAMRPPLAIGFFSGSDFALPILDALHTQAPQQKNYAAAVRLLGTKPPYTHRGKTHQNSLYTYAIEHNIESCTPDTFGKQKESLSPILSQLDVIVTASYGFIIPQWALKAPRFGWINWHPSALPQYRGPSPVQQSILDGITESAVTWIQMEAGMDSGDILLQTPFLMSQTDTFDTVIRQAVQQGALNVWDAIHANIQARQGAITLKKQNPDGVSITHFFTKQDGFIDVHTNNATTVSRSVRALQAFPQVRVMSTTHHQLVRLDKIGLPTTGGITPLQPGTIQTIAKCTYLCCADNTLLPLLRITLENGTQIVF